MVLEEQFDAVVMLTWSDWKTEPRSNRYHYATRFARHLPVLFVQPDGNSMGYSFEGTELPGVTILHVPPEGGPHQCDALCAALREKKVLAPVLWIYSPLFSDLVATTCAPLKVYHATEDYFTLYGERTQLHVLDALGSLLTQVDLLICVSEAVLASHRAHGYRGPAVVVTNGCDANFYSSGLSLSPECESATPVALYQGGINYRLDIDLLVQMSKELPDWRVRLCGRVRFRPEIDRAIMARWTHLLSCPNVEYVGELPPDRLRGEMQRATVGLIPFVDDSVSRVSFPLKAFEYVACGLPVVTVPIPALRAWPQLFTEATGPIGFAAAVRGVASTRWSPDATQTRLTHAKQQDYEEKFRAVCDSLDCKKHEAAQLAQPLKVLVLYDRQSTHVAAVREHLESFKAFSKHAVFYSCATDRTGMPPYLRPFDVVVIHYSVRVSLEEHLNAHYAEALRMHPGLKVLFLQDEYDCPNTACNWIERLGIQSVFSACVPENYRELVYPSPRFKHVDFRPTLTGYVPRRLEAARIWKPLAQREYLIGYRGRELGPWYGALGRQKLEIGRRMKEICAEQGLRVDIEWSDDKRIYGAQWYEFISNCRATLATESGSDVFDFDGSLKATVEKAMRLHPEMTSDEAYERYIRQHDGKLRGRGISPKVFEAIALGTALVMFEGHYSGAVEPGAHYIVLNEDFSNVDEVLGRLKDDAYLAELTQRAYRDVVQSGRYSYRHFIEEFDRYVERRVRRPNGWRPLMGVVGWQDRQQESWDTHGVTLSFATLCSDLLDTTERTHAREATEAMKALRRPTAILGIRLPRLVQRVLRFYWDRVPTRLKPWAASVLQCIVRIGR